MVEAAMPSEREMGSRDLIRRMHDVLADTRDPGRVDEFFAPRFVSHSMPPGLPPDREGVKQFLSGLLEGLPDLKIDLDLVMVEADLVTVRSTMRGTHTGSLMGVPASGRRVAVDGIDIMRVEDGRIVEHWGLTDTVGLLHQVGTVRGLRWAAGRLLRRFRRDV
jgi:predicted ester cyclase